MKVLGIEFSSSLRSVALIEYQEGQSRVLGTEAKEGTRETQAFAMIQHVLDAAGADKNELEMLALGLGPGSYGGMRVALSVAQGWQLATGIPTAGIRSMDALAEGRRLSGQRGALKVVIDAQRREFHLASYELTESGSKHIGNIAIVSRSELLDSIQSGTPHIGPDAAAEVEGVETAYPDAAVLARMAGDRGIHTPANELQPVYIRPMAFVKAPVPRTDL